MLPAGQKHPSCPVIRSRMESWDVEALQAVTNDHLSYYLSLTDQRASSDLTILREELPLKS